MATRGEDLTGKRFGKLTVIEKLPRDAVQKTRQTFWRTVCDCGNEHIARGWEMQRGNTKQCRACSLQARNAAHNLRMRQIFGRDKQGGE